MYFISMYSVLNTLSEYTYFYKSKNIPSYTFLLVFKIVKSSQCILKWVRYWDLIDFKFIFIFIDQIRFYVYCCFYWLNSIFNGRKYSSCQFFFVPVAFKQRMFKKFPICNNFFDAQVLFILSAIWFDGW